MFGNLGQIAQLLKNAGQMKENMAGMTARLQAARFVGQSGGGQVQATVDGRGEVIGCKIDPALLTAGDIELLEDLVAAAFRDAARQSREAVQKEVQAMTGGMNLPGLMDMLGGGS